MADPIATPSAHPGRRFAENRKLGAFAVENPVRLRHNEQFAMLVPAPGIALELGINPKAPVPEARMNAMTRGGMCPYRVRLSTPAPMDAEVLAWVRCACESAG